MQKIPYSDSELEIKGEFLNTTVAFGAPPPIYNTPITVAENLFAALKNEHLWIPTTSDIINIESRVNLDHVARAEIRDLGPIQPNEEKGGPDLFGIRWVFVPTVGGSMEDPSCPHPLEDANEWYDKITFPDVDALDWNSVGELNAPFKKETRIVGCCFQNGLFERLISFMGFEGAVMALIDEDQQDAVLELMDKLADMYIKMIQHYIDQLDVKEVLFHDDWGSQRAPFFSVETCIKMIVPALRKIADFCHSKGMIFQQHSCGKNELLVPAMIEAHVDMWSGQPMNDKAMLYEKYGDKIILGIEAPPIPADASQEEIEAAAKAFAEKYNDHAIVANIRTAPPAFGPALYKYSRLARAAKA